MVLEIGSIFDFYIFIMLMNICYSEKECTVKAVLKRPLKNRQNKDL